MLPCDEWCLLQRIDVFLHFMDCLTLTASALRLNDKKNSHVLQRLSQYMLNSSGEFPLKRGGERKCLT